MSIFRPIQTLTAGWLSLLGLKNLGQNPVSVTDEVRPVSVMDSWWLRGSAVSVSVFAENTSEGEAFEPDEFAAAESEWLWVYRLSMFAGGPNAATNGRILLEVINQTGQRVMILNAQNRGGVAPGGPSYAAAGVADDVWVPPGHRIRFTNNGDIGDVVNMCGLVARLRV